jgi:hypothetical protein
VTGIEEQKHSENIEDKYMNEIISLYDMKDMNSLE